MSPAETATFRLWTPSGFQDDPWIHAETDDDLATGKPVIVPVNLLVSLSPHQREAAGGRLGVQLSPADKLETIAAELDGLALVALAFPAFNDGRSFSKAELLRSRYGFAGTVRATGQILVDQLPHMLRLGFNEFEVADPVLIRRLTEGRIGGLPLYYQPSVKTAAAGQRFSWRRRPAA